MDQFMKEVGGLVAPKDERGEDTVHPYEQLEKAQVLQDARIFHDSILVRENPRKCCRILAKILYLQNDPKSLSSHLTSTEATELFFASSKLFVDAEDASLRRLVYLFIKEMLPLCDTSDVIIVTSCLMKDMTCDVGLYRANAMRVLVNIIDSAMLGSIERYIKQAIVDNDLHVRNAALVSASRWFQHSVENATIVRRWIGEVQETLVRQSFEGQVARGCASSNNMVQANAIRLLCQMKSHDRLGMAKLVQKFGVKVGSCIQSPVAIVILIRLCGKLLFDELDAANSNFRDVKAVSSLCNLCFEFLETSLSHRDRMISYEAARTICTLPNLGTNNLSCVMGCLGDMLLSEKPVFRYAAVLTLSKIANYPRAVVLCHEALEKCVDDGNKQLATSAVTTLLKTGSEATVNRMLLRISTLLDDIILDEYKIVTVRCLEELCLKYPSKHGAIVGFMASFLREEGGFDFKCSIVDSIISLMHQVPEMSECSLLHLCEFIEDCEYATLCSRCIHVIAELGPTTQTPARYIRFLYNRIILDNQMIRAAAVAALSKFAAHFPSLRASIVTLLKHCLDDEDDETRDRASVAVSVLKEAMALNPYVAPVLDDYDDVVPALPVQGDMAAFVYLQYLPMSFKNLERSIEAYVSAPGAMDSAEQLSFSSLPIVEDPKGDDSPNDNVDLNVGHDFANRCKPAKLTVHDPAASVYAIPELGQFGRVFCSSVAFPLTEEETEYVVSCIKHILPEHIILQFFVQNTVENQRVDNCTVAVEPESDSDLYQIIGNVSAEKVDYGETVSTFAVVQRIATKPIEPVRFSCQLNFTAVQVDPDSGEPLGDGYDEEYPLENLLIAPSDYLAKIAIFDFRQAWNNTGNPNESNELVGKFIMHQKVLDHAVSSVLELLGMAPCDGSGQLPNISSNSHILHLSGEFLGGRQVLARAQLTIRPSEDTLLKIAVRSDDKHLSAAVMSSFN